MVNLRHAKQGVPIQRIVNETAAKHMLIEYNGKKKNPAQRLSMNKLHARESSIFSGLEDSTAPDEEWTGDSETEEDSVF